MWDSLWTLAMTLHAAAEGGDPAGGSGESTSPKNPLGNMWIIFIAFIAIMYFLMIRPNQKRERERREMLASLSKGDEVVTQGGVRGAIVGLKEKTVVLRVSDNPLVKMEFMRGAVSRVDKRDDTEDD